MQYLLPHFVKELCGNHAGHQKLCSEYGHWFHKVNIMYTLIGSMVQPLQDNKHRKRGGILFLNIYLSSCNSPAPWTQQSFLFLLQKKLMELHQ